MYVSSSSAGWLARCRAPHLDVLGTIEEDSGYEELIGASDQLELAGKLVHVLSLERLIRVKEKLARPKDQLMLLILRATLDERSKT